MKQQVIILGNNSNSLPVALWRSELITWIR